MKNMIPSMISLVSIGIACLSQNPFVVILCCAVFVFNLALDISRYNRIL
jgi:hypothetical protein